MRKEHQMQSYSTIIGVIELRQGGIGYRTTQKRYGIGNSTITLIMDRFTKLINGSVVKNDDNEARPHARRA